MKVCHEMDEQETIDTMRALHGDPTSIGFHPDVPAPKMTRLVEKTEVERKAALGLLLRS